MTSLRAGSSDNGELPGDLAADPGVADAKQLQEHALLELDRITGAAGADGLHLRLIGSVAVRHHSPGHAYLLDALNRRPYRDLDFMGYSSQANSIQRTFAGLGYEIDPEILRSQEYGIKRLIFTLPRSELTIDVFLDDLVMAHRIPFRDRLELDSPTVSVVDLLLSKLQIARITVDDLKDLLVLLAAHEFGDTDRDRIDLAHLLQRMRRDWGFYTTASRNLELLSELLDSFELVPESVRSVVNERIETLVREMAGAPKSLGWRLRARVGTRLQWYEDVDEVRR